MLRSFAVRSLCDLPKVLSVGAVARAFATKGPQPLDHTKLTIRKATTHKPIPPLEKMKFGHNFSDHMLQVPWNQESGWGIPSITPLENLSLHPAVTSLHYGLETFEGMKAYKDAQGHVRLFRPDKNMLRMCTSNGRLYLPTFDTKEFLECIKELLRLEDRWIPYEDGYSLYIRPTTISTEPRLGVGPASNALLYVILSPVGPYYAEPLTLLADPTYVRAWPGGTGDYKVGGNYAGTILPQVEAGKQGFGQILWLFGEEDNLTEVGTMNIFVHWTNENGEEELITPPLSDGTILPGVTRMSVLELANTWEGFVAREKRINMKQVIKAVQENRIHEIFGAGTAAIVSAVKGIFYKGKEYTIPLDKKDPKQAMGPVGRRLKRELLDIQYGRTPHPWSVLV